MDRTILNCVRVVGLLFAVAVPLSVLIAADTKNAKPVSGIDRSTIDASVKAQNDFNQYVNGGWIARTEIPADKSRWGSFFILREQSISDQRKIIEDLVARKDLPVGSEEKKIADLYASLMDEGLANRLGVAAVKAQFERIDRIASLNDLVTAFAELLRSGVPGPIDAYISADSDNSTEYAVYFRQAGLGLPNRNYYLKDGEKFDKIRSRYPDHIAKLFSLAGLSGEQARAKAIYAIEMKIAEIQWTPEDSRDVTKTHNRFLATELKKVSNQIDWKIILDRLGMTDRVKSLFVQQPSYVEKLGSLLHQVALDEWKDYLRFRVLSDAAPWLSDDFVQERFEFFGKLVDGVQELEPRWQRAARAVDGSLGDAVGKIYVEKYFSPDAKRRMNQLVANLLDAFKSSLQGLEWMSAETKVKAEEKRSKFTIKIGYPDEWKNYSALEIRRDDPVGNLHRARTWDYDRRLDRLGKPVDRNEWFMTPQTVNAYYNPRMNEIVFPAAILQPPFFNLDADDAVNYGGIGAVIGHEMGHAFDDQGRKTDGEGNLNDWWTNQDAVAFKARSQALVDQYNAFRPLPDLNVNGQLTLGENIGDLTGLYIAYKAYKMSLNGAAAPVIDGLSGDQRFFMGYAQIWRSKYRDEAVRRQVLTDPHSPAQFRVNGPLRNFGPFYEAFQVKPGDGMYLPQKDRIQIW